MDSTPNSKIVIAASRPSTVLELDPYILSGSGCCSHFNVQLWWGCIHSTLQTVVAAIQRSNTVQSHACSTSGDSCHKSVLNRVLDLEGNSDSNTVCCTVCPMNGMRGAAATLQWGLMKLYCMAVVGLTVHSAGHVFSCYNVHVLLFGGACLFRSVYHSAG